MSEESKNLQPKETALPATRISETQVMALAQALEAVETYVPTTWVDDTEPDIDAEHLNHAEQGIKRVTDALNLAVDKIQSLEEQIASDLVTSSTFQSTLANYIMKSAIVDNLLSTSPDTVLSGKMGKQLNDAITALNSDCKFRMLVPQKWITTNAENNFIDLTSLKSATTYDVLIFVNQSGGLQMYGIYYLSLNSNTKSTDALLVISTEIYKKYITCTVSNYKLMFTYSPDREIPLRVTVYGFGDN